MTVYKNLEGHRHSQCHVEVDCKDGEVVGVVFVSYVTPVIFIKYVDGKRFVECSGTYSPTTRKQIGWFLMEYAPDLCYYDMKDIVGDGLVEM